MGPRRSAQQRHRRTRTGTDPRAPPNGRVAQTGTGATADAAGAPARADARRRCQLTLDDAVKLALERNLDIAVQRLNPQTFDYLDREPAQRLQARR